MIHIFPQMPVEEEDRGAFSAGLSLAMPGAKGDKSMGALVVLARTYVIETKMKARIASACEC